MTSIRNSAVMFSLLLGLASLPELRAAESRLDELLAASEAQQQELARFRAEIERLESEFGPFDISLVEVLAGLTEVLEQGGDFEELLSVQQRRLQLARSNYGLNDMRALPFLEDVIDAQLLLNDWEAVEDSLEMERSIVAAQNGSDESMLAVLRRQMQWTRAMIIVGEGSDRARQLMKLRELSDLALDLAEALYADDLQRLADWRYRHALSLQAIVAAMNGKSALSSDTVNLLVREDGPTKLSRASARFGSSFNLNVNSRFVPFVERGEIIGEYYVLQGRSLIDDSFEQFEELGALEQQAVAAIYKGDFLILSERSSGIRDYREAAELLQQAGIEQQRIDRFFAQPRPLPLPRFARSFEDLERLSGIGDAELTVTGWERSLGGVPRPDLGPFLEGRGIPVQRSRVELDISTRGRASGVKVLERVPEEGQTRRTVREGARSLYFRPPIIDDRMQRVRDLEINYILVRDPE